MRSGKNEQKNISFVKFSSRSNEINRMVTRATYNALIILQRTKKVKEKIMIKSNLPILMAQKGCRILSKVSKATSISRTTLTAIYYGTCKGIQYETLNKLCVFFDCQVGDLLVYSQ